MRIKAIITNVIKSLNFWVVIIFMAGVMLRYFYIFHWHQAMDYVYSDMEGYFEAAKNFCDPDFVSGIGETVHPPGTRFFFGTLMSLDPNMNLALVAQFLLSVCVPILLAAIAYDLFGRRCLLLTLCMASLYFPFIDYAGYILSEGPFLFTLVCSFWLLIRSLRSSKKYSIFFGFLAGLVLGMAASLKSVALPGAFLILLAMILISRKHNLAVKRTITASLAGVLIILIPLSVRCTKLSEGKFCLIANDWGRNILFGHYGDIGEVSFFDPERGLYYVFGSPTAAQKGYHRMINLPVGAYDNSALLKYTLEWAKDNPLDTFLLSFEHMFDLAFGLLAWPSNATKFRRWVQLYHEIFLVFILFPACLHICLNAKNLIRLNPRFCGDLLLVLPIIGVMFSALIALGEPRYRIPFDGFLILLAARTYTRVDSEDTSFV